MWIILNQADTMFERSGDWQDRALPGARSAHTIDHWRFSNADFTFQRREMTMKDEIYSIYHLSIDPMNFAAFEELIQPIVEATSEEPDTTIYQYVVNADRTVVHIVERYRTQGLLPHVEQTFTPFAKRFLELATIEKLYVYGETTPEIRAKLDGFGAQYLTPFAGFSR
jgi:quinol monooxygenase YgiN